MPGFDGTGPVGRGPGTGRGFGACSGARGRAGRYAGRAVDSTPEPTGRGLYFRRGRRRRPAGFNMPRQFSDT